MMLPSVHELIKPPMLPLDPYPTLALAAPLLALAPAPSLTMLSPSHLLAPDYFGHHGRLNLVFAYPLGPFMTPQPAPLKARSPGVSSAALSAAPGAAPMAPFTAQSAAASTLMPPMMMAPSYAGAGAGFPQPAPAPMAQFNHGLGQVPPMMAPPPLGPQFVTAPPAGPVQFDPHYVPLMVTYNPYLPQALPLFAHFPLDYPEKRKVIKRRTRTGCLTCRKRRIKCDERKPKCHNCERLKKVCLGYEQPGAPRGGASVASSAATSPASPTAGAVAEPTKRQLVEKMAVENLLA